MKLGVWREVYTDGWKESTDGGNELSKPLGFKLGRVDVTVRE